MDLRLIILCICHWILNKTTLWPLVMVGVQLFQGYRATEETIYFFLLSHEEFLVLIWLISEGWNCWIDLGVTQWFLNLGPLNWESSAPNNRPTYRYNFSTRKQGILETWDKNMTKIRSFLNIEQKSIISGVFVFSLPNSKSSSVIGIVSQLVKMKFLLFIKVFFIDGHTLRVLCIVKQYKI